ncbi:MAG: S-layer homology domain-containing protein [Arthrospira platensis PCC 7345]|nr:MULTISPECIES: S-layer homology domain-containing protein [Arthrospira]MDF2211455.1 S-layer homology domain-containing protein [Arthrospira platensis NCB002]MDT9181953.1 S-layer homology domain-containing protein [Limnospira sp. PMC 289.06]MDT9295243.1 S-layer homology domain-containing protein [Arthrospira platensis PCC 7345]MDT9309797.1 S-layer homology domain-containing protein [Limnospira sp. Paracas R14]QQW31881.2 S-layer homology domain-containing protein [Arthrospira sp. PCC 9108]
MLFLFGLSIMLRSQLSKFKLAVFGAIFVVVLAVFGLLIVPSNPPAKAQNLPVDVQPTDFYFQSLQSLIERYDCFSTFPDGTFRGNRALTRFELAVYLSSCMNSLEQNLTTSGTHGITKSQVAALQNRIDALQQQVNQRRSSTPVN